MSLAAGDPALVRVGERVTHVARYTREDIARFATLTGDRNPVHQDADAARRARLPDVIASGQHTSALMSGLAATHFSRRDDGVAREMLCLNFNFAYQQPVLPERDVAMAWEVREVEWNESLQGYIAQLAGEARQGDALAVVARGTVLVRAARPAAAPA